MNSESASTDPENDFDKKRVGNSGDAKDSSSNQRVHINGMSNGYNGDHKSSHKDKHRDKDREHKHKSSSSKDKEKHRDKERSKDHKSSSRDKEKDRDKERSDKERSDKDKERTKDKEKHRDKDKHHDEKKSSKEHKSSSSSSKDKEHKSSSSSRDKDRERSEKDKDRGERDRDRSDKEKDSEKEKEKNDRDRHKYSSSKDKHSSSKDKDRHSSSKDKHHSKDKDRKDRDKHRDLSKSKSEKSSSSPEKKSTYSDNSDLDKKKHYKERMNCIKDDTEDEEEIAMPMTAPVAIIKEEELDIKEEDNHESWNVNVSATSSCDYNLSAFKSEPEFDQGEPEQEIKQEQESGSDDDMPLASRTISPAVKRKMEFDEEDDDDDKPLFARKKVKKEKKAKKRSAIADDDDDDFIEKPKKKVKNKKEIKKEIKKEQSTSDTGSPKKRKKKEEEEQNVWKWWEEEKKDDGTKWNFLEHKGPVFAPPYEPLPENVKFFYDGKEMKLSEEAEEVAGFYARMLEHDYTTKDIFNNNFFKDWRKCMTEKERSKITDLKKCNFKNMHAYFMDLSEKNRNRTKEEKEELKKKNAEIQEEYGFCTIDGHKEKIGNFKIEPPGLFRGRGEHPKMGMLKRRVVPEDVLINCAKNSKIPVPPAGHKWKEVRHDPTVTWLASWTENVQNQVKYVMLNPSSKLKGEKDWQKYETARKLAKSIDKIRREYRDDWKSKEMRIRQRAVALYFIDKLALRAGNEKDEDQADTVGCCSLRVEHISLHEQKDGKEYVVVFDFLGKDSIRYYNEVPVEKRVFKNLQLFMENKAGSDDLFDRLNTAILNKHLNELMEGLTAKVFRTYNASWTLQQQLDELTNEDDSIAEKILSYNRANRAVAILCNHQRSVPKGHAKSMEKLKEKIDQKKQQIHEAERQVKDAQKDAKHGSVKEKLLYEKKKKMLDKMREQLKKLEVQETDRDENKSIALGTSKLNYLDPRISVAWCKKYDVPIEKIYNKTQRDKFRWAIDMAGPDYVF